MPTSAESSKTASEAAELLGQLLPLPKARLTGNTSDLDLPRHLTTGLHPLLADQLQHATSDTTRKLYLASQLVPLRHRQTQEKKKTVSTIDKFLRDGLSVSNHDRQFVTRLYNAADLIQRHLDSVGTDGSRVQLGWLRRKRSSRTDSNRRPTTAATLRT
jgi:hypothetical protein